MRGSTVCEFPPLVVTKLGVLVLLTVRFTCPVCPCFTVKVPWPVAPRFELKLKFSVVAVRVKLTAALADKDPEAPVTVTLSDPAATLGATEMVTVVDPLPPVTVLGLKLHEMPV